MSLAGSQSRFKPPEVAGKAQQPTELRAIALAALCDVKYARLAGGWKADTALDLQNYLAALGAALEQSDQR